MGDLVFFIFINGVRGFFVLLKLLFGSECDDNNVVGSYNIMYCCVGGIVVFWLVFLLEFEVSGSGLSFG